MTKKITQINHDSKETEYDFLISKSCTSFTERLLDFNLQIFKFTNL